MKQFAWLALLLVVACSGEPSGSKSSPAVTPVPAVCRLPVVQANPWQPGFLSIPGGAFTPAADETGTYFDRPFKRWVPWRPPWLSADGERYAYVDGDTTTSRLHIVDVQTRTDRVLATGGPWLSVGLDSDAAYVMHVEYVDSPAYGQLPLGKGLWQVPLNGSQPTQLTTDSRSWTWAANRIVYGGGSTADVAGGPNPIVRLDSRTRDVITIFDRHMRSRVLGVETDGTVLVAAEGVDEEIWWVGRDGSATEIWRGDAGAIHPWEPVVFDGQRVWLSSSSAKSEWAIYRYSPDKGMKTVATFADGPMTVAGPCMS